MEDLIRARLYALDRIEEGKPLKNARKPQFLTEYFIQAPSGPSGVPVSRSHFGTLATIPSVTLTPS